MVPKLVNVGFLGDSWSKYGKKYVRCYCTFVPPRVRVRTTVKLSAAFFHDESSITIVGGGGGGVRKCNSAVCYSTEKLAGKVEACSILWD